MFRGYASSFEGCLNSTKLYVEKTGIRVVPELTHHDIYAFSYFYDRGLQAQLVPRATDSRGGSITVGDYMRAAKRGRLRVEILVISLIHSFLGLLILIFLVVRKISDWWHKKNGSQITVIFSNLCYGFEYTVVVSGSE